MGQRSLSIDEVGEHLGINLDPIYKCLSRKRKVDRVHECFCSFVAQMFGSWAEVLETTYTNAATAYYPSQ